MVLLCKQKALYVKCCVIPNGVTDSQGDCLYTEDIKKIFTSFNNQDNFEVYHNNLPVEEVSLLENYISTADETIGTAIVPSGSWMATLRVDNPEVQEGLLNGKFGGVSLYNRVADKCGANLHGVIRYEDVDAECVIPLFISFVKAGANGYGLHVMDYPAFIAKSSSIKKGAKKMAFNLLEGLKSLVKQAEEESSEPVIIKEDKTKEEEEQVETQKETTEEVEKEESEIKKEDDNADSEEKEISKDDAEDDFEAKVTAIVKKVLAELEAEKNTDDNEEDKTTKEDEDTPKIVKSSKVVVTEEPTNISNNNYYEMTGRDPLTGLPKQ